IQFLLKSVRGSAEGDDAKVSIFNAATQEMKKTWNDRTSAIYTDLIQPLDADNYLERPVDVAWFCWLVRYGPQVCLLFSFPVHVSTASGSLRPSRRAGTISPP